MRGPKENKFADCPCDAAGEDWVKTGQVQVTDTEGTFITLTYRCRTCNTTTTTAHEAGRGPGTTIH